jgi:hypothetical protein
LEHDTKVMDWEAHPENPQSSEIVTLYKKEIEDIVKTRLYPGKKLIVDSPD